MFLQNEFSSELQADPRPAKPLFAKVSTDKWPSIAISKFKSLAWIASIKVILSLSRYQSRASQCCRLQLRSPPGSRLWFGLWSPEQTQIFQLASSCPPILLCWAPTTFLANVRESCQHHIILGFDGISWWENQKHDDLQDFHQLRWRHQVVQKAEKRYDRTGSNRGKRS